MSSDSKQVFACAALTAALMLIAGQRFSVRWGLRKGGLSCTR